MPTASFMQHMQLQATSPSCKEYSACQLTSQADNVLLQNPMLSFEDMQFVCSYECIRCGDKSRFDTSFEADDDENEAYAVMDNLKAAMANK